MISPRPPNTRLLDPSSTLSLCTPRGLFFSHVSRRFRRRIRLVILSRHSLCASMPTPSTSSLRAPPLDACPPGPRAAGHLSRVSSSGRERDRRVVAVRVAAAPTAPGTFQGVQVGFQGKPGAYSEIACEKAFQGCDPRPYRTFGDVFKVPHSPLHLPLMS